MRSKSKTRRGIILPLVLVVVAMLSLAALSFAERMINERRAAITSSRQSQARAFAQSGAELARQFLDRDPADQQSAGGIYDNPSRFADQLVADEPAEQDRGHFSIVAPKGDGITLSGVRYGLQDESTRINLATILSYDRSSGSAGENETAAGNTYAHTMLMGLPGMTDEIADAILDWIDADDNQRPNGAESQYYASLSPPYAPRNGPPVSIEELLLVRGVTPELLFGLDAAKMGLSSNPDTANGTLAGVENSNGEMDHGWAAYLTLWSAEGNLRADGTQKINLNGSDLKALYDSLVEALDEPSAEFIVAYRLGGKGQADSGGHLDISTLSQSNSGSGSTSGGSTSGGSSSSGGTQVKTLLDLIGATATLTPAPSSSTSGGQSSPGTSASGGQSGAAKTVKVNNPFTADSGSMSTYLPKLFANCTTASKAVAGRININQASHTVLLCIPHMTSDLADAIISQRAQDPNAATDVDECPAWPLIKGLMPLSTMKSLMPYITAGGGVYRAQVIGSFEKGNTSARVEVVIDATQIPSRIVFWKDISRLQGGFPVEPPPAAK
jgi:type II secretory pathway component PulK